MASNDQWWRSIAEWQKRLGADDDAGSKFRALCPAHDDNTPSLDVELKNGVVVWKCRAGCDQMDVVRALDDEPVSSARTPHSLAKGSREKRLEVSRETFDYGSPRRRGSTTPMARRPSSGSPSARSRTS